MGYAIGDFWQERLGAAQPQSLKNGLTGWSTECTPLDSFVEPSIALRLEQSLLDQPIWLIAAPGAVGKSTLAKQICSVTNAVYVDLAAAATVAGNYLTGGLVNAGLLSSWEAETTTLLIDALDEARLRVTQASFEDFLCDVVQISLGRSLPVILLGRIGIVEEARKYLADNCGFSSPVFDIELFDLNQAKDFVWSALVRLGKLKLASSDQLIDTTSEQLVYPHLVGAMKRHADVYRRAIEEFVNHLSNATSTDGGQFVGYAPVLDAVATVIAAETNVAKVTNAVEAVLAGKVLTGVTQVIMEREAKKVANQVATTVQGLSTDGLYASEEQLERLASLLFNTGGKVSPPACLPAHAVSPYEDAVKSLLPQHPFLDGNATTSPSSAVFEALIVATSLWSPDYSIVRSAESYARMGHVPNPFLLDFYMAKAASGTRMIPAAHVGLLYDSLQAKANVGEVARLSVEGEKDSITLDLDMALVSVDSGRTSNESSFSVMANGTLKFGSRVSGINVDAENTDVEMGDIGSLEIVAPVNIRALNLIITCDQMLVKPDPSPDARDQFVLLEATNEALTEISRGTPLVRQRVALQVSWPGSNSYPWSTFTFHAREDNDPRMADAQRALRRLCMSFRSHSKGQLARYVDKVEHFRMTKGNLGLRLRQKLMEDKVLSIEGQMYILNPDTLGAVVGISFQDLKLKKYSTAANAYLAELLED